MPHISSFLRAGKGLACIRGYQIAASRGRFAALGFAQLRPEFSARCFSTSRLPAGRSDAQPLLVKSALWNRTLVRHYSDLPSHQLLVLPALSPTMETGSLVSWEKKVGDEVSEGDLLCEIETDKATMGFEANDSGFLAKVLVPQGAKGLPLGTPLCVIVENKEDVGAFADVTAEQLGGGASPAKAAEPAAAPAASPSSGSGVAVSSLPPHVAVPLPALSPTMEMGNIVSWEKKEGEFVKEGDLLAEIETDKATMGFEASEEGYLAKIFVPGGEKGVPLGTLLCVLVENEEDVAKFKGISASDLAGGKEKPKPPQQQEPQQQQQAPQASQVSTQPQAASGDRLKASPYARKLANELGVPLEAVGTASGSGGRIVSADVEAAARAPRAQPQAQQAQQAQQPAVGDFVDLPLSGMRATIAKRLTTSKQTVPHYNLTVKIAMDKVLQVRQQANKQLGKRGVKLSVNDFIIKAVAVALGRVPECNSAWQDTFIRQYNKADICVAVATDNGLITPIVFNADAKGLININADVVALAEKARSGKLRPEEFQGGTFTISNLGMFGIHDFSAIINPPQSCILAVGGAQKQLVPSSEHPEGYTTSTMMFCTLCCDHRVVDGAVGAKWLAEFKQCLEEPYTMLL